MRKSSITFTILMRNNAARCVTWLYDTENIFGNNNDADGGNNNDKSKEMFLTFNH